MRKHLVATFFLVVSLPALASMEAALSDFKQGNYGAAIKALNSLGDAGDMKAQIMLGALYNKGGVVARNDQQSAFWFEKAASQGNVEAQYQLGSLFEDSQLPRDYETAASWYKKAAQHGSAKAQARLGVFYSHGMGVVKNANDAILWTGKAALQGNADAQYWLGVGYVQGKTLPKNSQLGLGWLNKAAAQGHADALLLIATAYQRGEGTPKDSVLAYALNSLALARNTTNLLSARSQRDELAALLSADQLAASKQLAAELQAPNNFTSAFNAYIAKAHQAPFRFFDRPEKSPLRP